ncbi:MAG: phage tail length tape measure family protein [Rhodanobacter sp.]
MAVQDYELLLRVRADMIQAINGLDGVRKKLDDTGKQAKDMGDKAGKAVDGMSDKFGKLKTLIAGLAIGAGIKAVFGAVQESENAVAQLDARLKSTGGSAGLTRDQLIDLSGEMQKLTTYGDEAVLSMETLLLSLGNIKKGQFEGAVTAVLDVATAKSMDLASAATQIGKALNDPIKGLAGLQKIGISFTDTQKDVIQSLVDTGQTAAAQQLILDQLKVSFGGAAEAAANTFGGALEQLKNAAGDLLEGDGGNLNDTTSSIKELTHTLQDPAIKEGFTTIVNGMVQLASWSAKAVAGVGGLTKYLAESFARSQGNVALGDTVGIEDRNAAIEKELQAREGLFKGYFHRVGALANVASPVGALSQLFGKNQAQNFDLAKKSTEELNAELTRNNQLLKLGAELTSGAAKPKDSTAPGAASEAIGVLPTVTVSASKQAAADKAAADKAAADAAKFIAAGEALQGQLTSLQGSLDPTAAAWNTYNAAVEKANASAELARKAPGANAESIEAQRKAVIGLAASVRDAEIAKVATADRDAWEKLRDSLRTPAEVKLDAALDQIKQLDDLMGKTSITAEQYAAALKRIGEGAVIAAPKYQGVDAAVGGPMGELGKNFAAATDLDKWYADQQAQNERILADNDKFRGDDLARQQAYAAAKAETDRQYAAETQKIEQGRQQLTLTASADFFGQLANLQHSSNNKIARIGKAAAIAQAIINTYQSATAAFAAMASIPYVGPALGAAAAAVAVATGLANVAQIRAQPDSYADGGYTGPGGKYQFAGYVHAGEGVLNQEDMAALGGPVAFERFRRGLHGYADGGFVDAVGGAHAVVTPDFDRIAAQQASAAPNVHNNFRFITALDANDLAQRILETPAGEKAVVNHVIANGAAVKQGIG